MASDDPNRQDAASPETAAGAAAPGPRAPAKGHARKGGRSGSASVA